MSDKYMQNQIQGDKAALFLTVFHGISQDINLLSRECELEISCLRV